nr:hypothetical protein BaRGS_013144 [Batillaria attramentaria]
MLGDHSNKSDPGSGKTSTGRALLRRFQERGYAPYVISHVRDWHAHVGEGGPPTVVLMDGTLEEKQCFTAEAKAKRARLISNAWEGRHCYLGNSFLPIPNTLINVHMSDDGDKLRVMVPSKQWYLVLRLLADREVDERDEKGNTTKVPDSCPVIAFLILHSADVNAANSDGETAFHEACLYGNTKAARLLKDYGADPGLSTGDGDTALHLACRGSHRDSAEFVLQCGVDIDAKNNKGETALYQACHWHGTEMVRFLLGHGAGTDRATEDGDTPLHVACRKGWDDTTDLLLENSADLRAKNCRGNTPLHTACSNRHTKIASLLIRRKIKDIETHESTQPHYAEVDDRTHSGDAPLDVASRKGHRETKDVLIEHGATIKGAACFFENTQPNGFKFGLQWSDVKMEL